MKTVRIRKDGAVGLVELNRPEKRNALSLQMKSELAKAIALVSADPETRVVVLTGSGTAFCAGADLSDLHPSTGIDYRRELRELQKSLIESVVNAPKPFIAAVNGPAIGGGFGLALACDLIVVAEDAYFDAPVARTVGIAPDFGLSFTLQASIGLHRARSVLLFGHRLTASEALEWGLAYRLESSDLLLDTSIALARELAVASPSAVDATKRLLNHAASGSLTSVLDAEADQQSLLRQTPEHLEAVAAFKSRHSE